MSQDRQPVEIIAPAPQEQDNRSASARLLEKYQKRFQPGESGNPGGRPKLRLLSRAAREQLAEVNPETGLTGAEEVVAAMMKEARKGNIWAAKELREWTEGKVPTVFLGDVSHSDSSSDVSRIKTLLMQKLIRHQELPAAIKENQHNE
jgi:hypothetical protein